MFRSIRWSLALLSVAGLIVFTGCPAATPPAPPAAAGGGDHGDHDHAGHDHAGHDHAHHGPHDGHIIEIGEEEYHAEWTHDDSGLICVYILDKEMKKEVPIAAQKITITVTTKKPDGDTVTPYELLAANASEGEMPKASKFEITDKTLLGSLETLTPGAVEAGLSLEIEGKPFQAAITADEHAH